MSEAAERYRRAKAIFLAASDVATAQRADYLDVACAGDAVLRSEVDALLVDERTRGATLDRLDAVPAPPTLPGYRIERELGRGGMGVVWLAERDSGDFRQRVALKLLAHDALRDPERRARFRAERRILASLEHPNIAHLLDGGSLADGTPYLAMEYVEGERLDDWVQRTRPKLPTLLRLFVAICRAVQAAHQRLVVHRDLKPANILVDASGAPKLLDFGIAKLLDDSAADEAQTATGMQLLTPRYAAPEQVRGEAVTTATDVYTLGVVLYELLTGQSPYGRAVTAAPDQLRAICDTDPLRPSLVVRADPGSTTSGHPSARLRGDLDAILLKCLRKPSAERYRGAAELADDLEAYLDGRPVEARAGSTRYALTKFIARHRYLVASSLLVLAVLVAATFLLLRQLEATRRQRDLAASERDKAEQVTEVLVDLLRNADPAKAKGQQLTVRDALQQGEAELERRLLAYPATRSYLYQQLALIHAELGDAAHALKLAQRALQELQALADVPVHDLSAARYVLALALIRSGRGQEARPIMRDVERHAAEHGDLQLQVDALVQQAVIATEAVETKVAAALNDRVEGLLLGALHVPDLVAAAALEVDEARRPFFERLAANGQIHCGALADARDTEAALRVCTATADLKRRVWPPDHPGHLSTQGTLAMLAGMRGDNAEALRMRREVLAASRRVFGDAHMRTAYAVFNLGVTLKEMRQVEEAEALYREALATLGAQLGPEHRSTLVVMNNLANLLTDIGKAEAGRAMHVEALEIRRRVLGDQHADVAQSLMNVAAAEAALEHPLAAIRSVEQALQRYRAVQGAEHHDTTLAMMMLARYQLAAGQAEQAEQNIRSALAAYEKTEDEPDERGAARFLLARVEWALGRHQSALSLARASLEVAREHGGSGFEPELIEAWLAEHQGTLPR